MPWPGSGASLMGAVGAMSCAGAPARGGWLPCSGALSCKGASVWADSGFAPAQAPANSRIRTRAGKVKAIGCRSSGGAASGRRAACGYGSRMTPDSVRKMAARARSPADVDTSGAAILMMLPHGPRKGFARECGGASAPGRRNCPRNCERVAERHQPLDRRAAMFGSPPGRRRDAIDPRVRRPAMHHRCARWAGCLGRCSEPGRKVGPDLLSASRREGASTRRTCAVAREEQPGECNRR